MGDTRTNVLCPMTTIWVVSWVYWNGDEQGGGGFNWFWDQEAADAAFDEEVKAWEGAAARIRMLPVHLPRDLVPDPKDRDSAMFEGDCARVTEVLDSDIDFIEDFKSTRATRVALLLSERAA